jgi:4-oxalocrotonate tautomerase
MPHVLIKLVPGRSERQKKQLTEAITEAVATILGVGEESLSVAFEEVSKEDWPSAVFAPDIRNKWDTLYKKPGYSEKDL